MLLFSAFFQVPQRRSVVLHKLDIFVDFARTFYSLEKKHEFILVALIL